MASTVHKRIGHPDLAPPRGHVASARYVEAQARRIWWTALRYDATVVLWRIGVAVALVAAAFRVGGLGSLLPEIVWYGLQFGPLLMLAIVEGVGWIRSRGQGGLPRKARWVSVPAAALVLVAASSALWAVDPGQTISQAGLLAVVFLFLITSYAHRWTSSDTLNDDLKAVLWTGIGIQALGVAGYFAGQEWAVGDYDRLIGVTPNANYIGMGSAVLVALSFAYSGLWVRLAALIPLIALVLSDSRGSMVGLVVGLAATLIMAPTLRKSTIDRTWVTAVLLATPLLFWLRSMNVFGILRARISYEQGPGGPTGLEPGSEPGSTPEIDVTSGRIDIYREYLANWLQRPWLGTGYRSPQLELRGNTIEAHNVYLSVLVELGVLGAVVLMTLFVGMLVSATRSTRLIGAAVTALAVEVTESSLFGLGGPTAVMSWLVLFGWAATGLSSRLPSYEGTTTGQST